MPNKKDKVVRKSYQPVLSAGDSYQPVLSGKEPQKFVPPKGGTGARNVELKVVTVNTEKKK
ncbi:MAG: hypothetical protein LBR47_02315 [Spirochaetaceae bacterium]|nr:hypothetical protein [Spirochaetaceae bacterium]